MIFICLLTIAFALFLKVVVISYLAGIFVFQDVYFVLIKSRIIMLSTKLCLLYNVCDHIFASLNVIEFKLTIKYI